MHFITQIGAQRAIAIQTGQRPGAPLALPSCSRAFCTRHVGDYAGKTAHCRADVGHYVTLAAVERSAGGRISSSTRNSKGSSSTRSRNSNVRATTHQRAIVSDGIGKHVKTAGCDLVWRIVATQ